MSSESKDINNAESWSFARRYATLLGPIPSSVSGAIKTLWAAHEESLSSGELEITSRLVMAVKRVDRSAVLKTPLYFAAQKLFPEKFSETVEDDTSKALLHILGPGMFASLLGLIYMHRRYNKVTPKEEWEQLSKEYVLAMEYGLTLGQRVAALDPATCMLVGGIRYAALATYLMRDKKSYAGYRNLGKDFDVEFELERWGCDHGQIAGHILKALGFYSDYMASAYAIRGFADGELSPELARWRGCVQFYDGFIEKKNINEINFLASHIQVTQPAYDEIISAFGALQKDGTSFNWMFRSSKESE